MRIIPLTDEQSWLGERLKGLTTSDIPPLLGIYPSKAAAQHRNPYEIWRQKTGKAEPPEMDEMRLRLDLGHAVEPRVAQEVENREGVKLVDTGDYTLFVRGLLRATPDRLIVPDLDFANPWVVKDLTVSEDMASKDEKLLAAAASATGVLEIKSSGVIYSAKKWAEGGHLDYALIQAITAAMVLDVEGGLIAAIFGLGLDYSSELFTRHEKIEGLIRERAEEFWECVLADSPPGAKYLDDSEAVGRSLAAIWSQDSGSSMILVPENYGEADDDPQQDYARYKEIEEELKALNAERREIKNRVQLAMTDHTWASVPGTGKRWQWATETRSGYTVEPSESRVLRVVNEDKENDS